MAKRAQPSRDATRLRTEVKTKGMSDFADIDSNATNVKPTEGKVFVAITMLTDVTFDTSAGLVADNDSTSYVCVASTDWWQVG